MIPNTPHSAKSKNLHHGTELTAIVKNLVGILPPRELLDAVAISEGVSPGDLHLEGEFAIRAEAHAYALKALSCWGNWAQSYHHKTRTHFAILHNVAVAESLIAIRGRMALEQHGIGAPGAEVTVSAALDSRRENAKNLGRYVMQGTKSPRSRQQLDAITSLLNALADAEGKMPPDAVSLAHKLAELLRGEEKRKIRQPRVSVHCPKTLHGRLKTDAATAAAA